MNPLDLSSIQASYPTVTIKGEIFNSKSPVVLSEDLLEVSLPSGRTIDVGWYPEHNPSGSYRVLLYRDHTGYPLKQIRTKDVFEVIQTLQNWIAADSTERTAFVSASSNEPVYLPVCRV